MTTAKCQYCNHNLPNMKAIAYRCSNCNSVWCINPSCPGSSGRSQYSRTPNSMCLTCQKAKVLVKV